MNVPVYQNFDFKKRIGTAKVYFVENEGLKCTITGLEKNMFNGLYAAPCYKVDSKEIVVDTAKTINSCEIDCIGITTQHSNRDIPPIKVIDK